MARSKQAPLIMVPAGRILAIVVKNTAATAI